MKRFLYLLVLPLIFISCKSDEPAPDDKLTLNPNNIKRTVLIYAVNRSSLSYDFNDDLKEMLEGVSQIDLSQYQLLIYKTDSESSCGLYSVVNDKNGPTLKLLREYDRKQTSTAPFRINEVISYSLTLYPNSEYDLIFWGHGMSWKPYYSDHIVDTPQQYAYGGEYTGGYTENGSRETDWTEIDDLADCVPDNTFNTIWFDCCYMTGIEVIYEFRNKCKTFVGYPSEVWSYGLSYDLILPYLLSKEHDVVAAAKSFFDFYNNANEPVTVAVIDMKELENVAQTSKEIIFSGKNRPDSNYLLNYSRTSGSPFYDFRQFFTETAILNDREDLSQEFKNRLNAMTLYHAESDRNFSLRPWDSSNICGISTHYYMNGTFADEAFYETLSWFKRVYQ